MVILHLANPEMGHLGELVSVLWAFLLISGGATMGRDICFRDPRSQIDETSVR